MESIDKNFNTTDRQLIYEGYNPEEEPLREALCTLGNGYFATRGAHESTTDDSIHYPGTYIPGGYNRLESNVRGQIIENEDLVNWPNWLPLTFRYTEDEVWFSPDTVELTTYRQILDLKTGTLTYIHEFMDDRGRKTRIESMRFIHMGKRHLASLRWRLTPLNWSGDIIIRSALDGRVSNNLVARYRQLNGNHLQPLKTGYSTENIIYLKVRTVQSDIHLAQAARTEVFDADDSPAAAKRITRQEEAYIAQDLFLSCRKNHPLYVEKVVSLHTSRDVATSESIYQSTNSLVKAPRIDTLYTMQKRAWKHLWERFDHRVEDHKQTQKILHLHAFHLLQTISINSIDLDTGIPPRGLHGEAYRGHIMWDELFVFPFLNYRLPVLTRSLLMYRYRRLDAARNAAREAGYKGAMFPWQSGSDGREESQSIHLNPLSGRWVSDITHLQRHVGAAIAYSIQQYYQTTDDKEFLYFFGAELILEIARFWCSLAEYNPDKKRYEIKGVIGPDEYHTAYPSSERQGIDNNAYTNIMAVWVLKYALKTLDILDTPRREELCEDLQLSPAELQLWDEVSRKMFVPFMEDGIIAQFEGYDQLKELDWVTYRTKHGENLRLDRILESENDSVNNYKASKQADVLMLFYLFSSAELRSLFERLEYPFDPDLIRRAIDYYRSRTSHGSTLSRLVFSWVQARSDRDSSWKAYEKALVSDFRDVQGGTTPEGIHLAAMAGTLDIMQRCYSGVEVRDDVLYINPHLPEDLHELSFRIRYRSHWMDLTINRTSLRICFEGGWGNPVTIEADGERFTFSEKGSKTISFT
ncbi:MAG: glycoside hydrolase family 65 protein [Chitinivibrionales bacterium]|nr:glycoside hydrolase family 65 protein [Chitinivibrionales bacterium]